MTANEPTGTPEFLVFDCETTGTAPDALILELAYALVTSDLKVLTRGHWVFPHPDIEDVIENYHPWVQKTHRENGLWADCQRSCDNASAIEAELPYIEGMAMRHRAAAKQLVLDMRHWGAEDNSVVIAGFSVHNDLMRLRNCLPELASFLSHRVRDLSSLHYELKSLGHKLPSKPESSSSDHRATKDMEDALQYWRAFRARVALPLPIMVNCPICGYRHVDDPGFRPHKTHECQNCGLCWRPADVPTVGVEKLSAARKDRSSH